MALTLTYNDAGKPMLSKVKIGESIYYLKDSALRAIVEDFGAAVNYEVDTAVTVESGNLITSGAVHKYVTDYVTDITGGAMTFVGVFEPEEGKTNKEVLAEKVSTPAAGYVAIVGTAEYVYANGEWNLYGDEGIYATVAGVEEKYVKKAFEIAGLALDGNAITAEALKAALGINNLGALAFVNAASGTINTIDSITGSAKGGEYAVVQTPVNVPATYSALDVTPAGNVNLTTKTAAQVEYEKVTSVSVNATEVSTGSGNYQPKGSITLPGITITHTPNMADVATVTDAGTGYSLTGGGVSQGEHTTQSFATSGMQAELSTEDSEMLVFKSVETASAITQTGSITYASPTLTGSLPIFGTKSVVTGMQDATANYDGQATFAGTEVLLGASANTAPTSANVTQPAFTASFEGTTKTVTPTVATHVQAAGVDGKIDIADHELTLDIKSTDKTVTVAPTNNG